MDYIPPKPEYKNKSFRSREECRTYFETHNRKINTQREMGKSEDAKEIENWVDVFGVVLDYVITPVAVLFFIYIVVTYEPDKYSHVPAWITISRWAIIYLILYGILSAVGSQIKRKK